MKSIKIIFLTFLFSNIIFASNVKEKELQRGIKNIPLSKAYLSHENGGDSYASNVLKDGIGIYSTAESDYSKTIAELNSKYGEEAEKAGETLKDYVKENGTPEEKDLVDEFVYAVPNQSIIGAFCDDGDPKTGNDIYLDTNFTCVGERIYAYADKVEKIEYADKFLQTVYNSKIDSFEYINKVNNTYYQPKTTYIIYGACPTGYVNHDATQCRQEYVYANKIDGVVGAAFSFITDSITHYGNDCDGDPYCDYVDNSCDKFISSSNGNNYSHLYVQQCPAGYTASSAYIGQGSNFSCPVYYGAHHVGTDRSRYSTTCTPNTVKVCPSGYTDYGNATQCRKAGTALVNKPTSTGYDACISPWVNHDTTQCKQVVNECPAEYSNNGINCVKTIQICPSDMIEHSATECKKDVIACPSDYQDIGANCSKSIMICPDGYEDMGNNCRG